MGDPRDRLREFWEQDAATYDLSASHSLSDPREAAAWRQALRRHLPPPPARVLDAGSLAPFIEALPDAGWRRYRVERLREMERLRLEAGHPLIARLEAVPRFAILAE